MTPLSYAARTLSISASSIETLRISVTTSGALAVAPDWNRIANRVFVIDH
jgi:hypothetical protein